MALPDLKSLPWCRLIFSACLFVLVFSLMFITIFDDGPLTPYLCNTTDAMIQCRGLDDVTTCANVGTVPGGVDCVESACGHQLAHGLDISVNGVDTPPGPTVGAGNGTPASAKSGFMIFWSFVPYGLFLVLFLAFLWAADTSTLAFIFVLGFVALVNEAIFKNLLEQNRPRGSCLYFESFGMPSGHAASSVGTLTYATWEIWYDRPDHSLARRALTFSAVVFFLAPVSHSRVYLNDHFRQQVGVGSAEGLLLGSLWFLFMYKVAGPRLDGWLNHRLCNCYGLRNTYRNGVRFCPPWSPCGNEEAGGDMEEEEERDEDRKDVEAGVGEEGPPGDEGGLELTGSAA